MSNSTVITIKTEEDIKEKAQELAAEMGLSLSGLLNRYLKRFVKTKSTAESIEEDGETPSPYLIRIMKQAEKDRKAGKGSPIFTSNKKLIKQDPKRYMHINDMDKWFELQGI